MVNNNDKYEQITIALDRFSNAASKLQKVYNITFNDEFYHNLQKVGLANAKLTKKLESINIVSLELTKRFDAKVGIQAAELLKASSKATNKINSVTQTANIAGIRMKEMLKNNNQTIEGISSVLSSLGDSIAKSNYIINPEHMQELDFNDITNTIHDTHKKEFDIEDSLHHNEYMDLKELEKDINVRLIEKGFYKNDKEKDIVYAINELTNELKNSNKKDGLKERILSGILVALIVELVKKLLTFFLAFIIGFTNPTTHYIYNKNQALKETKREVAIMGFDRNFYNSIRIVIKDNLEVRKGKNINSPIIYNLDFQDKVRIKHKNKNWTKVEFYNFFTNEINTGWVFTRYIERLD